MAAAVPPQPLLPRQPLPPPVLQVWRCAVRPGFAESALSRAGLAPVVPPRAGAVADAPSPGVSGHDDACEGHENVRRAKHRVVVLCAHLWRVTMGWVVGLAGEWVFCGLGCNFMTEVLHHSTNRGAWRHVWVL